MSDEKSNDNLKGWSRRRAIRMAATAGLGIYAFPSSVNATDAVQKKATPPKPYRDASTSDEVHFTHVAEFDSTSRALELYESTGEPTQLFQHELLESLRENPHQSTFNLVVNTMGERASTKRDADGVRLRGFRPTEREVEALSRFGEVTHVGDVVSTKVCLRNVARGDIARIAHLPSIVEVGRMPDAITPNEVDASNVVGNSWDQFKSAHGNYSESSVNIGIVGAGYDYESYGAYSSNYAQDIGLDKSLSKDFTDESDPFDDTTWSGHSTDVGDTAAYMLKDGDTHSDLFVSLKVTSASTDFTDEQVRKAIEYATKNGIDVLNMSFGIHSWDHCPSHYCEELNSYTDGGGVPVAAVGNKDNSSQVEYPACSWQTVGTGGVHTKDSDGNPVAESDTEYGNVLFYEPFDNTMYCKWCYNDSGEYSSFSPEVYGVSQINTDAGNSISGTSYACPQVAAAAWIDFADGGIDSYSSAMKKFTQMNEYTVVNNDESSDAAREGQLMEADYYF